MTKKLDIKNLRVSFRTNDGTVKAVRSINMELNEGETLAVVGESGSGKSVTAKAVLGILAPNSIVESGEIIYDGKDLLKISEDEYHEYRGNKLSMIFQDPMSSLNPIMKIGKQLTEAMLLNGKSNQKSSKKEYNLRLKLLKENMIKAGVTNANEKIEEFNKISDCGINLEKAYNNAHQIALDSLSEVEDLLIDSIKGNPEEIYEQIKYLIKELKNIYNDYVIKKDTDFSEKIEELFVLSSDYKISKNPESVLSVLEGLKKTLSAAIKNEKPDFFSMAYCIIKNKDQELKEKNINVLNSKMQKILNSEFMNEFTELVGKGIKYSYDASIAGKNKAVKILEKNIYVFEEKLLDKSSCDKAVNEMTEVVENAIDILSIRKDNLSYTFKTSIRSSLDKYFKGIPANVKEEKRFAKENAKVEKLTARGKITHKTVPAVIVDIEQLKNNMKLLVESLIKQYNEEINSNENMDFNIYAAEMAEHLKKTAFSTVHKITKNAAKNKAVKLMKEVGIAQPRKRYNQYPFQFSGGMRQRIVIAIALAANPDILICDEPTTALDVTIQAQILELINNLKKERNLSVIFITHDLGVVANMADRIAVMYAGKVVECGTVDEIFYEPVHPYTWALLASMPDLDTKEKLDAIPGTPPNMVHPPKGDAFAPRNKYALEIDLEEDPPLFEITPTHYAATWLLHPDAPKVEPPKIVADRIERMKKMEVAANG